METNLIDLETDNARLRVYMDDNTNLIKISIFNRLINDRLSNATFEVVYTPTDVELNRLGQALLKLSVEHNRGWVGLVGQRDPEFPCPHYDPEAIPVGSSCAGDGHYLCLNCGLYEKDKKNYLG